MVACCSARKAIADTAMVRSRGGLR
jgi:hypothetical protein